MATSLYSFLFLAIFLCACVAQTSNGDTLLELTNNYRTSNDLSAVPVSLALMSVAQIHANLLAQDTLVPDCTLFSWPAGDEDSTWEACCYVHGSSSECIWKKPSEITGHWPLPYSGGGTELVISLDGPIDSNTEQNILNAFISVEDDENKLTNKGDWSGVIWAAMGAGVAYNEQTNKIYATLWLGTHQDRNTYVAGFTSRLAEDPSVTPPQTAESAMVPQIADPGLPLGTPGDVAAIPPIVPEPIKDSDDNALPNVDFAKPTNGDQQQDKHNSNNVLIISLTIVSALFGAAILTVCVIVYKTRRVSLEDNRPTQSPPRIQEPTLEEPEMMTDEQVASSVSTKILPLSPHRNVPYTPARLVKQPAPPPAIIEPPASEKRASVPMTPHLKTPNIKISTHTGKTSSRLTPAGLANKVLKHITPGRQTPYEKLGAEDGESKDIELGTINSDSPPSPGRHPIPFPMSKDASQSSSDEAVF